MDVTAIVIFFLSLTIILIFLISLIGGLRKLPGFRRRRDDPEYKGPERRANRSLNSGENNKNKDIQ